MEIFGGTYFKSETQTVIFASKGKESKHGPQLYLQIF